jgi:mannose-6-phosphate isomerase-like protein (cupin superfamily)
VAQHDDLKLPLTATAHKHANENAQEPIEQRHQHEAQSEPVSAAVTSRPVSRRIDFLYPTGHLAVIDVAAEAAAREPWFNQTLTSVNEAVVRLGVIEGDFQWHQHEEEDEFFLVLEGELVIELQGRDPVRLRSEQAFTVPKGVSHKTSAPRAHGDRDGRAGECCADG